MWNGGVTAVHATLVYWENTEESFEKIKDTPTGSRTRVPRLEGVYVNRYSIGVGRSGIRTHAALATRT